MARGSRRRLWFLAVVGNLVLGALVASSQVPRDQSAQLKAESRDTKAFDFVLSGMKQEREKLVSGVCRMKGTFITQYKEKPQDDLDGPLEMFMAFDNGKIRYDLVRLGWVVDPNSVKSVGGNRVVGQLTMKGVVPKKLADDKVRVTVWNSDNASVSIARSEDFPDRRATEYFDIRVLNVSDRLSIKRGYGLDQVLTNFKTHWRPPKASVQEIDESTWVLILPLRDQWSLAKMSLTIDVHSGFTPRHYKCECIPLNEMGKDEKWQVEWEYKTNWEQKNGVWVPVHHEYYVDGPFSKYVERMDYDIEWESVNEPVKDDLFNYTTFDLPDHVGITDVSSGEMVIIKTPSPKKEPEQESRSWVSAWRAYIIGAIAIAVALFAVVAYRRRQVRRPV